MKTIETIQGGWNDEANAWVSETLCLSGDAWLEITLPEKGRVVIKKSETSAGPWPKALITKWTGPKFRIRLYGSTERRFIQIHITTTPTSIEKVNI